MAKKLKQFKITRTIITRTKRLLTSTVFAENEKEALKVVAENDEMDKKNGMQVNYNNYSGVVLDVEEDTKAEAMEDADLMR